MPDELARVPGATAIEQEPAPPDPQILPTNRTIFIASANPEQAQADLEAGMVSAFDVKDARDLMRQARPVTRFSIKQLVDEGEDGKLRTRSMKLQLTYRGMADFSRAALIGKSIDVEAMSGPTAADGGAPASPRRRRRQAEARAAQPEATAEPESIEARPLLCQQLQIVWLSNLEYGLGSPDFQEMLADESRRKKFAAELDEEIVAVESGDAMSAGNNLVPRLLKPVEASVIAGEPAIELSSGREPRIANEALRREELAQLPLVVAGSRLPITRSALRRHQLVTIREVLARFEGDIAVFRDGLTEHIDQQIELFEGNVRAGEQAQTQLKDTYLSIHESLEQARGESDTPSLPIRILNVQPKSLSDPRVFEMVRDVVPAATSLRADTMVSLIGVPRGVETVETLRQLGELGRRAKALVVVDAPRFETLDDLRRTFQAGGRFDGLKGRESWKRHVALVGNSPTYREYRPIEDECGCGVELSSALILTGMMIASDDRTCPADPVAGDRHPISLRTVRPEQVSLPLPADDRQKLVAFGGAINPVAERTGGKLAFWNLVTLSDETEFAYIPVVRVRLQAERVLTEYLNSRTFSPNDEKHLGELKSALQDYIRENSGKGLDKMLAGGKVVSIQPARDRKGRPRADALHIRLDLAFKYPAGITELEIRDIPLSLLMEKLGDGGWQVNDVA